MGDAKSKEKEDEGGGPTRRMGRRVGIQKERREAQENREKKGWSGGARDEDTECEETEKR
jgi:hypothetical protein